MVDADRRYRPIRVPTFRAPAVHADVFRGFLFALPVSLVAWAGVGLALKAIL